jgi:hypothetical protein
MAAFFVRNVINKLFLSAAQYFQKRNVRTKRAPNSRVFDVLQIELLASFLDQFADGRVMNMTDTRKKMMFDLKIQSAETILLLVAKLAVV